MRPMDLPLDPALAWPVPADPLPGTGFAPPHGLLALWDGADDSRFILERAAALALRLDEPLCVAPLGERRTVPARARARLHAAVHELAAQGRLSGLRVRALDTALWPHGGIATGSWPQRLACVALPTDARVRQGHWPGRWRGWLDGGGLPLLFLGRDGPPVHRQALLPVSLDDDARAQARVACLGLLAPGGTAEWLHVSDLPRHRIDPGSRLPRRVLDQVLQAEYRERYLRLLALAQLGYGPSVRCYVAQGAVAAAIERHQRTLGHDLVVLGWGRRAAAWRCWRPPLAEGLLRLLDCDLLVLPAGGRP